MNDHGNVHTSCFCGEACEGVSILAAFAEHERDVQRQLGPGALDVLVAGHRLWRTWLADGRVRKLAVVAQRVPATT